MVAPNPLDLGLVLLFWAEVATAFIARWTALPITALEIVAGLLLVALLGFTVPAGKDSIIALGGPFTVSWAGIEILECRV
ncbi:MAG: hypothetical protein L3K19_04450 [Thermoplasmata archaeon]|nr:hypothetical protein [Thermoplasmata archaeon]